MENNVIAIISFVLFCVLIKFPRLIGKHFRSKILFIIVFVGALWLIGYLLDAICATIYSLAGLLVASNVQMKDSN